MQIFSYEIENSNWEGFGGVEGDAGLVVVLLIVFLFRLNRFRFQQLCLPFLKFLVNWWKRGKIADRIMKCVFFNDLFSLIILRWPSLQHPSPSLRLKFFILFCSSSIQHFHILMDFGRILCVFTIFSREDAFANIN